MSLRVIVLMVYALHMLLLGGYIVYDWGHGAAVAIGIVWILAPYTLIVVAIERSRTDGQLYGLLFALLLSAYLWASALNVMADEKIPSDAGAAALLFLPIFWFVFGLVFLVFQGKK